ncbi:hypothetical protein [Stenotrophomonas pictorum]|uniref:hypothetical protein n=1 Tax=Stenotrophomonas pictorum TaxID=86184 RepID=UPI0030B8305A
MSVAFWIGEIFGDFRLDVATGGGLSSQAMQQGGMGLILTTLILTAPPMAAMFFQGTLGSFMAYSQIGGAAGAQPGPQGQPPGSYLHQAPENNRGSSGGGGSGAADISRASMPISSPASTGGQAGRRGMASND